MLSKTTRVHQRYLGLITPSHTRSNNSSSLPHQLHFGKQVQETIEDQLHASGTVRGGPLFGHTVSGVVTVVAAPLGGYRVLDPALATDPLTFDPRYVLGWVDALNYTSETKIDWVGNWVMWPNSVLGSLVDDLAWIRRGRETDLISTRHCLCAFGWDGDILGARAYTAGCTLEEVTVLPTYL
ncbi:hypothetical protein [Deinococcus altitudinis]|uniref:hypothetical protein n=1 Tax=Deinococcus altitudinis TaxID=468914 RepID=UPI003891D310